jgi:hypothetical protein
MLQGNKRKRENEDLSLKIPRCNERQIELDFVKSMSKEMPMLLVPSPCRSQTIQPSKRLLYLLDQEFQTDVFTRHELRLELIEWIEATGKSLLFIPETIFLTVFLFDRFIAGSNIRIKKQFYVVAVVCIYIIGKTVEELSEPKIQEIVNVAKYEVSMVKIREMERRILKFVGWELSHVTPWSVLDEVLNSVGYPDARTYPNARMSLIRQSLEKKVEVFMASVIKRFDLMQYPAAVLLRCCLDILESRDELVYTKLNGEVLDQLIPFDYDSFLFHCLNSCK